MPNPLFFLLCVDSQLVLIKSESERRADLRIGSLDGEERMSVARNWKEELTSREQLNLFNAACGDLAEQIVWHGFRLSKDDWRHLISGTILGWRFMPAIDRGEGQAGLIALGGSSLCLSKAQCTDAITQAFLIGDDPESQGLKSKPVRWCKSVCGARWIADERVAA